MRIGILSDVHSNLEALRSVLDALSKVDAIWCLGDTVGYGANPQECLAEVRRKCNVVLMGNHDDAVAGGHDLDWFNPWAKEAILWTQGQLSPEDLEDLSQLPTQTCVWLNDNRLPAVWLAHGSLRDPVDEYILNPETAAFNAHLLLQVFTETLSESDAPAVLFFGHTHVAEAYFVRPQSRRLEHRQFLFNEEIKLEAGGIYLINCGSVGQPRDGNPMAAFGILYTEAMKVEVFRITYDIDAAASKILKSGLPSELAFRLYQGW